MSLNNILASAQKLGMPVVITDRQGENAQVVMPFDDFLALTHSVTGEGKQGIASGSLDDLDLDDDFSHGSQQMDFSVGELDGEIQAEMDRASAMEDEQTLFAGDPFSKAPDSGAMEEKFYLEPLGEEESR